MKRKEGESFEDYELRRKEANEKQKRRLKGKNVFPGDWGTYRKYIDGIVESRLLDLMQKMKNKNGK